MDPAAIPKLRERFRRIFFTVILILCGILTLAFAADFLVFRIRVATHRNAYGTVTVSHYFAVSQKNGRTQFMFDPPREQSCVNALFPHDGNAPCWYLRRHPEQRTDI
jgi:hypothetical protein